MIRSAVTKGSSKSPITTAAARIGELRRTIDVSRADYRETVACGEQRMRAVEAALNELSPKCRAVFVLFHFDGQSQREIADRLGISVCVVEQYVEQAVTHCERRLAQSSHDEVSAQVPLRQ